jgi:hypothetical protein
MSDLDKSAHVSQWWDSCQKETREEETRLSASVPHLAAGSAPSAGNSH